MTNSIMSPWRLKFSATPLSRRRPELRLVIHIRGNKLPDSGCHEITSGLALPTIHVTEAGGMADPATWLRPTEEGGRPDKAGPIDEMERVENEEINSRSKPQLCSYPLGDGRQVTIIQTPEQGIGWQLWDASSCLADFLLSHPELVSGKTVLELGAGCGLCGLVAGALGARKVHLTDTSEVLSSLQANVDINSHLWSSTKHHVGCGELDWTEPALEAGAISTKSELDIVLISDCTYWQHLFVPLVRAVVLNINTQTSVILAHKWRRPEVEEEAFSLLLDYFETASKRSFAGGDFVIMTMALREDVDLSATQREILSHMDSEASDVQALLSRLDAIERDMSSISV